MTDKPYILTIAGFDPCAGAGLLADIKAIEANGGYGMAVLTALTYQNENEFDDFEWSLTEQVIRQIDVLSRLYQFNAVKIGMIQYPEMFAEVLSQLSQSFQDVPVVWDPILGASAGTSFHASMSQLQEWGQLTLMTPNMDETRILFGTTDPYVLQEQLREYHLPALLLKGGHSDGEKVCDYLILHDEIIPFDGDKFHGISKHGTGCVLSSTIATLLGRGFSIEESCGMAKETIHRFIHSSPTRLGYHNYHE